MFNRNLLELERFKKSGWLAKRREGLANSTIRGEKVLSWAYGEKLPFRTRTKSDRGLTKK